MRTLSAAALALAILAAPAAAQTCHPLDAMLENINQAAPITARIKLDAVQTAAVVAWWNSQPPESEDSFNLVVLLQHADGRLGLLLGNDDLACKAAPLPPELVPSLMRAIAGTGA